jgi:hypothetical protein
MLKNWHFQLNPTSGIIVAFRSIIPKVEFIN